MNETQSVNFHKHEHPLRTSSTLSQSKYPPKIEGKRNNPIPDFTQYATSQEGFNSKAVSKTPILSKDQQFTTPGGMHYIIRNPQPLGLQQSKHEFQNHANATTSDQLQPQSQLMNQRQVASPVIV